MPMIRWGKSKPVEKKTINWAIYQTPGMSGTSPIQIVAGYKNCAYHIYYPLQ